MNKKQSFIHSFIAIVGISLLSSSCMTTKTNMGDYSNIQGTRQIYAKSRQIWLFWGVIPLRREYTPTPQHGDCQLVTRVNFVDFLVCAGTAGIVTTQTVRVNVKAVPQNKRYYSNK